MSRSIIKFQLLVLALAVAGPAPAQTSFGLEPTERCAALHDPLTGLFIDLSASLETQPATPTSTRLVFTGRLRGYEELGVDPRDFEVFVTYPDRSGQEWIAGTLGFDESGRPQGNASVDPAGFVGTFHMAILDRMGPCSSGPRQEMRVVPGAMGSAAPSAAPPAVSTGWTMLTAGLFGQ